MVESLEIPSPQMSSGMAKPKVEKRFLVKEPKEVAIAFPNLLQYNVVSLLKYLDGKREKYAVSEEAVFYVKMLRNEIRSRRAASMKTDEDVETVAGECAAATASLKTKKHKAELTSWAKRLTECKTAKSLEVKCRLKLDADCDRLRVQLKTVEQKLEASRIRAKAAEWAFW
ncbi:hypothetical protein AXG93_2534s1010 [Marchantia polymorpha subsp. ruderalis]|uniref:Uncharacterized protein n=1 Tax=Marchantia polymorpha subsp. ruderalis TaxID=1480154 RepID=A0A176W6R7_MARPO|nr:hypothetical protein AXG93_2534s1010 [Marchantia polymorpha subsp. ruderalis]